jgi:hypothetical protein
LREHYTALQSEISKYGRELTSWNQRAQTLLQDLQVLGSHPDFPRVSQIFREEQAKALVRDQTLDPLEVSQRVNLTGEEFQLLTKLVALSQQYETLSQEGMALEQERQRLQARAGELNLQTAQEREQAIKEQEDLNRLIQILQMRQLLRHNP